MFKLNAVTQEQFPGVGSGAAGGDAMGAEKPKGLYLLNQSAFARVYSAETRRTAGARAHEGRPTPG
ncbi:MAG: hypothetical protein OXF76_02105 [Caldilineaceae bacterium]|nr:hypothetical protein [Caldilineaceae bacterium]